MDNRKEREVKDVAQNLMKGFPPPSECQVTKANWLSFPAIRWSSSHVRELLPTRQVSVDRSKTRILSASPLPIGGIPMTDRDGSGCSVEQLLDRTFTDAIVVLHKSKIVYEKYSNGNDSHTQHWTASATKSLLGMVVARLVETGELDYDARAEDYVPELRGSAFGPATIRHLMDMRVALDWSEEPEVFADPNSPVRKWMAALEWDVPPKYRGPINTYEFLVQTRAVAPPGERWQYASPTSDALGWVVERSANRSFTSLLSDLWSEAGAEESAYCILDPAGKAFTTGGVCATARDLARVGQLFVDSLSGQPRGGVTQAFVKDIQLNGDRAAFAAGDGTKYLECGSFRSLWWVYNDEDGAFRAHGFNGQFCYVNPAAECVIVRYASRESGDDPHDDRLVSEIFQSISSFLKSKSL